MQDISVGVDESAPIVETLHIDIVLQSGTVGDSGVVVATVAGGSRDEISGHVIAKHGVLREGVDGIAVVYLMETAVEVFLFLVKGIDIYP